MNPAETAAVRHPQPSEDVLLGAYAAYIGGLPLASRVRRKRYLGAQRLLKRLHGLHWHDASVAEALQDIDKDASAFIPFLLLFGHLRPGYAYLFSRKFITLERKSAHSSLAEDVAAVRATAEQLGYGKLHINNFLMAALRILAQTGKNLHGLTRTDLDEFRAAAEAWGAAPGRTAHHWKTSLHSMENVLYHMGIIEQWSQNGHRTLAEWLTAAVPQPELRTSMVRYVELMAAHRRPTTLAGYCVSQ